MLLVQMGLLSEEKVEKLGSPLDTISNHLASILSYDPSERDMVLMRHDVSIFGLLSLEITIGLSRVLIRKLGSPLDIISNHLASILSYNHSQRDI